MSQEETRKDVTAVPEEQYFEPVDPNEGMGLFRWIVISWIILFVAIIVIIAKH